MKRMLAQVGAIINYEFRLQWRRRALLVITLSMMIVPISFAFMLRNQIRTVTTDWTASGAITLQEARRQVASAILPVTWAPVYIVLALILPIVVADAIPKDRQLKLSELLGGLPLDITTYLTGKLFSVWLSVLAGLAAAMVLTGLVWWAVIGPFDLSLYLQLWLVGAIPLVILNAGLSALLAAGQPGQRRATLVGVAFSIASLFLLFPPLERMGSITVWDLINVSRPALFLYYLQTSQAPGSVLSDVGVTESHLYLTILAGIVQIILVWLAVWGWMRFKGETI